MAMDKQMTLAQAAALVPEGACLGLGGVTLYRRPMAFSLALMNRYARMGSPSDLTLLCFTAGMESDMLVGTGMVSKVRSCYFGLDAFGLAPHFTRAAANGEIEIIEETEASLANGLRATLAEVGFIPSTAWQGTDLLDLRPDVKEINDPYSGERLTAFPAIACDVAVIHALRADSQGNADIGKNLGVDRELALAADTVTVPKGSAVSLTWSSSVVLPPSGTDTVVVFTSISWPNATPDEMKKIVTVIKNKRVNRPIFFGSCED